MCVSICLIRGLSFVSNTVRSVSQSEASTGKPKNVVSGQTAEIEFKSVLLSINELVCKQTNKQTYKQTNKETNKKQTDK